MSEESRSVYGDWLAFAASSPWVATALLATSLGMGWYLGQRQVQRLHRQQKQTRKQSPRRREEESSSGSDSSSGSNDLDDTEGSDSFLMPPDEELKMVLCVRTDLNMQKGKMAAQCCHACLGSYRRAVKHYAKWVREWLTWGSAKIALKVPSEDLLHEIARTAVDANLPCYVVVSVG